MELVGKITKTRVTNEIWIASRDGEIPDEIAEGRSQYWVATGTPWPWMILRKHSRGWKIENGPYRLKELAYAMAVENLEEAYVDGHDVELATELDMETVEVPLGTIDSYFKNLIQRAKDADNPADLIKLREKIVKSQAVCDLLGEAQDQITKKLLEI